MQLARTLRRAAARARQLAEGRGDPDLNTISIEHLEMPFSVNGDEWGEAGIDTVHLDHHRLSSAVKLDFKPSGSLRKPAKL